MIELGGQDAKIIMFRKNEETGEKQVMTSMNDKCASGTGATIDKCMIKVGMPEADMAGLKFDAERCTTSRRSAACSPRPTSSTS